MLEKEDFINKLKDNDIDVLSMLVTPDGTILKNELLEDKEVGSSFFLRYPDKFVDYLSDTKYRQEYFTAIYEKMSCENLDKITSLGEIFYLVHEVIDAEGDGNHYFNDPNYIAELCKIDMKIIYLVDENTLMNNIFLEQTKDHIFSKLTGVVLYHNIERTLLDAVIAMRRKDDLNEKLSSDSNSLSNKDRKKI